MKKINPENTQIKSYASRYPFIGHRHMKIPQMLRFLDEADIRHLPILENNQIVGLVNLAVLKQAEYIDKEKDHSLLAEDIMQRDPFKVKEGTPLREVVSTMQQEKLDCALVVDAKGLLKGIFTTSDGLKMLALILRTTPGVHKDMEGIENYSLPIDIGISA